MKKLKINGQLLILFFSIIIIASLAFSVITLTRITTLAQNDVYSRLQTYVNMIQYWDEDKARPEHYSDMNVEFYIYKEDGTIITSPSFYENISTETTANLISDIKSEYNDKYSTAPPKTIFAQSYITINHTRFYYVCLCEKDMSEFIIVFTDSTYVTIMNRTVSLQMISVFFLLILLSSFCIFLWSNRFTRRIAKLQNHIYWLPKKKYSESYIDPIDDEIGELSKSIEEMRLEIEKNEKTKQEMLQNISHDFKTPIAVIKSYAEAQQDGMVGEESSKIIIAQADLLKKKVNTLLQYNSLEYLEKNKEFEDIDMCELLNEIALTYKFRTNIDIELNFKENVCFKGYRENMYTVIDNILDNAKRYAKTKISIITGHNYIRIYNDGEAIEEQFLNGMFKPYEKGAKGEFGLGMSIVKKTLDFFELALNVTNDEGGGVSFVISKPKK